MNRSCRSPLHYAFLSLAIVLALSACRSPVQGRAQGSLSLSLSIPADLSSDVPEPIRRALGEVELAGSRPRFIHPDGKTVTAIVTKADGAKVGSATETLSAGQTSATLDLTKLPLDVPLTLSVGVYDAGDAKVGERVVKDVVINDIAPYSRVIGILPYDVPSLFLGEKTEVGYSEPVLSLTTIEDRLYIYSVELPTRGLYKALLGVNNSNGLPFLLYDYEGQKVVDYVDDTERSGFGLFTNDAADSKIYYIVFAGVSSWTSAEIMVHREMESSLVQLGRAKHDPVGNALIHNQGEVRFLSVDMGSFGEKAVVLKNIGRKEIVVSSYTFGGDDAGSFSIPEAPASSIPPGGIIEFIIRFNNGKEFDTSQATLIIDCFDDSDLDFAISVSGTSASA